MRQPEHCPKNTFLSNTTRFTLCVYWTHKKNGVPYTQLEIELRKHRRYIDSFDYVISKEGRTVTNEAEAYYKLRAYCERNKNHIQQALIFMNDFANQLQYKIAALNKIELENKIIMPYWMKTESAYGQEHVYANGLQLPALDTYKLIQRVLEKKPININDLKQAA